MSHNSLTITDGVEVACTCGGKVVAGDSDDGPVIMHTQPTCADYDRSDPLDFLVRLRMHHDAIARRSSTP